jgi:hypothetical protein
MVGDMVGRRVGRWVGDKVGGLVGDMVGDKVWGFFCDKNTTNNTINTTNTGKLNSKYFFFRRKINLLLFFKFLSFNSGLFDKALSTFSKLIS